ncbi:MAG: peptide deformylase 2 [Patescibacteria group bacterium]|nr:MAG: peptide deformylase 2 [Patescibacteria group bacterium]
MAVRKISIVPDPVLTKKAQNIANIGEDEKNLAKDLLDTLAVARDPEGAGIAATQIGVSKKMCVVRNFFPNPAKPDEFTHEDYVLINPKIVSKSSETEIDYEGCLSVPGIYGRVERYSKIKVDALNINGERIKIRAEGFFARTIQHEIDHLEGILFTERVIGKTVTEEELERLIEAERQAAK